MKGEGFKIRLRHRRGYTREAQGYTGWSERKLMHHPEAKKVITEILEDCICITADDVREFLDVLEARGFAVAMTVKTEAVTAVLGDKR